MSTHGKLKIIDGGDPKAKPVWMYAWHTAITQDTVEALIRLPFLIHDAAKHVESVHFDQQPFEGRRRLVPWYYAHCRDFFMGGCMSTVGPKETPRPPASRKEIYETWGRLANFQLDLFPIGLANFVSWMAFNWWHVVRGPCDMSRPGGSSVAVLATVEGGAAFEIRLDAKDYRETESDQPGYYRELSAGFLELIGNLNSRIVDASARVSMSYPGEANQSIRVPFIAILRDLVSQDVEAYNAATAAAKKTGKGKAKS